MAFLGSIFYLLKLVLVIINLFRTYVSCDKYKNDLYVLLSGDDELFIVLEDNEDNECPICFYEEKIGDVWRILKCKHKYHASCVDEWIIQNHSCPECREIV